MTPSFVHLLCVLLLSSLQAFLVRGLTCEYREHSLANATGAISIPGFQPFIKTAGLTNSTWVLSTALNQRRNVEGNSYVIDQSFHLASVPRIEQSPEDLPYTGCAILLKGFAKPRISTGTNETNSCYGVIDTACSDAIISTINSQLLEGVASRPNICPDIIATPPEQCKNYPWTAVAATQPFGNPSYSASVNTSCPSSIWNGTANLITTSSGVTSPLSDTSTYDSWVTKATPLILVAFTKNVSVATPSWGKTALVCLTPSNVALKSRKPSSGGSLGVGWPSWALVMGASVLLICFGGL
ncbi:hypothetical protein HYFRA_00007579 [Hymenoscyphus fraxineus]|uniref:Uncharacterized protein n=1 Tax=Hymenoscyphus fraxineus TaxID=746836 RepID=A0A9N9PR87_9HELO|nr:hypothetical protein HYFRA_00007579 [Hymenoscyphus fraxineus]